MAKVAEEHTSTDGKRPFDKFQETVQNLLRVPKEELDEKLRTHEAQQEENREKRN